MSYQVVRVQKMTAGSVSGIQIHDRREKEISHTNPDIEFNRSHLNYDLHPIKGCELDDYLLSISSNPNLDIKKLDDEEYFEWKLEITNEIQNREKDDENYSFMDEYYTWENSNQPSFRTLVNERIGELDLKKAVRKDAVVMAQVLVTSDTAYFDNLQHSDAIENARIDRDWSEDYQDSAREFFENSYNFLCDRYGKENVISATVHMDERTPHMHFNFVPVTPDGRLSAKDVLTKSSLTEQQDKFHEQVGKKWGLDRGEPKEKGKRRKHLETAEYKSAMSEVNNLHLEASRMRQNVSELQNRGITLEKQLEADRGDLRAIQGEKTALQNEVSEVKRELNTANALLSHAHAKGNRLMGENWKDEIAKASAERDKSVLYNLFEKFVQLPIIKPLWEKFLRENTQQRARSNPNFDRRGR